jgi:hypothetical protein
LLQQLLQVRSTPLDQLELLPALLLLLLLLLGSCCSPTVLLLL